MANTTATNFVTVTVDAPDWGAENVIFNLEEETPIADNGETPLQKTYTLTLAADGTGSQTLPVYDTAGTGAWRYSVEFPDDTKHRFVLSGDPSTQDLGTILAAAATSETVDAINGLIANKADKAIPTVAGNLAGLDATGNLVDTQNIMPGDIDFNNYQATDLVDRAAVVSATITGTTHTVTATDARLFRLTLANSPTVTLSAGTDGDSYVIVIIQDGTGSRAITWSNVSWGDRGTPAINTGIGDYNYFTFIYNAVESRWDGFSGGGFT